MPILIVVIQKHLHLSEGYLGWVQTCMSAGALVMALIFIRMKSPYFREIGPGISLFVLGSLKLAFLATGSATVFLGLACLIGASMSFRQLSAELALLEGVTSETSTLLISIYNSVISFAYVIGYLLSAALTDYFPSLVIGGGLCILGAIYQLASKGGVHGGNQALPGVQPS